MRSPSAPCALALLFIGLRLWQRVYDERVAPGLGWLIAAVCAGAALVAYAADQQLLVRLYPFFHAGSRRSRPSPAPSWPSR